MILKSLNIYRNYEGITSGRIKFQNELGEIELILNDEACNKMLHICAEQLVESSKEVAQNLTANIIEYANMMALDSDQKLSNKE